jgi:uncharacterized protein YndB with AHSA1/START domain/predicted enzyme related to lactoylglutathione lyase
MNTTTLQIRRFIPASRTRVFAAFINPEDLAKWLGPGPCQCRNVTTDARVGGSFAVHMTLQDGSEAEIHGEYLEVRAPERLAFTWRWEGTTRCLPGVTQVTVDLVEIDRGTDVQLIHERLATPTERDNHTHGWTGSIDKLARLVAPEAAQPEPPRMHPGEFCWNELLTSDVAAAGQFYSQLFGWTTAPFAGPVPYALFRRGEEPVGGMMPLQQPGSTPTWLNYVLVADCEASLARAKELGATVCMPTKHIPTIGHIAILKDPLGADFGIHQTERNG